MFRARWWTRREHSDSTEVAHPVIASQSVEQGWQALAVMNEWVRHADAKIGVTLAFVGATAAILVTLVTEIDSWTCARVVGASAATAATIWAIACSVLALFPRVVPSRHRERPSTSAQEETVNLLFFGDVHRHYSGRNITYREVFGLLTADPRRMLEQIADQVHVNGVIATLKYKWTNRAIVAEIVAVALIALFALAVGMNW